ncbi:dipeptide transport system permease protein DppC [Variibacter gotjawalensis]|uniref:Dipeptide transport system permease protein DppC n=1 Tax=Variibacter gotjawalensis TaxID=1333996 RepID=A0A0S3PXL1_9BRAD|nr:ABC transporter permease [Variibacter gotjawalensis]NIK46487.1 peptide/nickel transport system permease protein [Variibacter gotjawalensis]RZS48395.1 peptide/nickel transport system permease protein [Variibacter gotjawalensis]BAT60654.1 dipeptide transport system permease protein DppC [Variibacter gotjawalensis]
MSDTAQKEKPPGWLARAWDSDIFYNFRRSKLVMLASLITLILVVIAIFAPWVAPHNPYDLSQVSLLDARNPPAWLDGGGANNLLGTDDQGRDLLSAIIYGMRASIFIGCASVAFAITLGVTLGLMAGYFGGKVDSIIMRIADVQLTFPAILTALLVDGIARALVGTHKSGGGETTILIFAIGLSYWVQYARTVRSSTLVERNKEYVQAARIIGLSPRAIMFRHVLPNVGGPVLVLATINLALAIITEATLSFLGVGLPPNEPSLGTLISIGNKYLFAGEWWIVTFPAITLAALVLAVNLLGDWLRDALNPRLR